MPDQYVATDSRTGVEVSVTGEFPDDPEDRVRIARTSTLFTRLMSTILGTEDPAERRQRFRAVETQMEVADAMIRGDWQEVQSLIRGTLAAMGVSDHQMGEIESELRRQIERLGGELPPAEEDEGAPA